jgi:putative DNA primase/helicase
MSEQLAASADTQAHKHTPLFFTFNALPFDYDPDVPEPQQWHSFLKSIWKKDEEAIQTLQEIFGYCLTPDTQQQKIFMLVGPKRSGKGTIGRILTALLGDDNVVAPTLAGIATNFGLAPLIGKPLAIISDARLGGRTDQQVIAERLLSISGEDGLTIDRKYLPAWTGRLQTRFLLLTNELPRIADTSGALASRFISLLLIESFYGREDHRLAACLLAERPGIFNWALAGRDRLAERGHFVLPKSSRRIAQILEDLGSPISAFVRDRCKIDPELTVHRDLLFDAWRVWATNAGYDPGDKASFGRDLLFDAWRVWATNAGSILVTKPRLAAICGRFCLSSRRRGRERTTTAPATIRVSGSEP